jgi:hypothetical protein
MKKILIISISILSVFILCSLSYQPLVAEDCGCKSNNQESPPICGILGILFLIGLSIYYAINIPLSIIYEWAKMGNLELILDIVNSISSVFGAVLLIPWLGLLVYFDCIDIGPPASL